MNIPPNIQALGRVLIVEDDETTRLLLTMFFREVNGVDQAAGAREALDHVRRRLYDLLLMDLNLGGTSRSGIQLLERIRRLDGFRKVPTIAITGHVGLGDREEILATGFDGYIAKPFTRETLFRGISDVLER